MLVVDMNFAPRQSVRPDAEQSACEVTIDDPYPARLRRDHRSARRSWLGARAMTFAPAPRDCRKGHPIE